MLRVAALLFLVACSAPQAAPRLTIPQLFELSRQGQTAAARIDDLAFSQGSRAHLIHPARCCQSAGNPVIMLPDERPSAGQPLRCTILSSWPEPRHTLPVFVAIGPALLQPGPFDLTGAGAPGCSLMVAWSALLFLPADEERAGPLRRTGPGRVEFEYPTRAVHRGMRLYLQAAVAQSEVNQAGLLTTAAVEWWLPGP